MTSIREAIRRRFAPVRPLEPGIYHYQSPPYAENQYRMHLRIEKSGDGILILNASTVLHLNQSAAEFAYHLIKGTDLNEVTKVINQRYDISQNRIMEDYKNFQERIYALIDIPDLDPVQYLDLEREDPYSHEISAPYRLNMAITYRLPEGVDPAYAPTKRVDRELTTQEWVEIMNKVWEAGVPHLIFTGGEPTLRDDLADLIMEAEKNGQVTGLITDGRRFSDPQYLETILLSGLDHLTVIMDVQDKLVWQALELILPQDLFTTVHLTISPEESAIIPETIEKLASMGVNAISLTSAGSQVDDVLLAARDLVAELGMELVWDLPVPYSERNPVYLESDEFEFKDGAGIAWMYVEPDGDVLPAQGINKNIGNLLKDDWQDIWSKGNKYRSE